MNNHTKPHLESVAYVEMYVGNIFYAKNFLANAMKFEHVSSKKEAGLMRYLMKAGDIYVVLTSSLEKDTFVSQHVMEFGDSIKKISFWAQDPIACFEGSVKKGAKPFFEPQLKEGILTSSVEMFNKVEHEFLQMGDSFKVPGFVYNEELCEKDPMIFNIDHIATCHPSYTIGNFVEFYKEVFGFSENKNEDIYSEESGMHIIIMKSPNGKIKLPLVEPSSDKSPLHTYLKFNHGSGVHHIAFATNDIIDAVNHYEKNFGELRKAPAHYYDELKISHPHQIDTFNKIAPYGIMVEYDNQGMLFQIFTKPVVTRPTFFMEFVQRDKCEGFGTVNIKTLYESLET